MYDIRVKTSCLVEGYIKSFSFIIIVGITIVDTIKVVSQIPFLASAIDTSLCAKIYQ
jgi:hypothetical protein